MAYCDFLKRKLIKLRNSNHYCKKWPEFGHFTLQCMARMLFFSDNVRTVCILSTLFCRTLTSLYDENKLGLCKKVTYNQSSQMSALNLSLSLANNCVHMHVICSITHSAHTLFRKRTYGCALIKIGRWLFDHELAGFHLQSVALVSTEWQLNWTELNTQQKIYKTDTKQTNWP